MSHSGPARAALVVALWLGLSLSGQAATPDPSLWANQPSPPSPGPFQLAVGGASNVWALDRNTGAVFRWTGTGWSQLLITPTPRLTSISVARDGTFWGIRQDNVLTSFVGQVAWQPLPAPPATLTQIAVSSFNAAWGIDAAGHAYYFTGTGWTDMTGAFGGSVFKFTQISAGSDGTVMAVLTNQNQPAFQLTAYFAYSPSGAGYWNVLAPQLRGSQVSVGDLRNGWLLKGTSIFRMPDTLLGWFNVSPVFVPLQLTGDLASLAASSDAAWGIDTQRGFWQFTGPAGGCGPGALGDFYLDKPYFGAIGLPPISAGSSGTISVPIVHAGGFDDFITLSSTDVPPGVQIDFPINPVGAGPAQVAITVGPRVQPGLYSFTLVATSGGLVRTQTLTFRVPARLVGYFTQWSIYGRNFYVKNADTNGSAAKLTHINYAFGNVVNNQCQVGVTLGGVGDAWADYEKGMSATQSVDGVADATSQALKGNWNQLRKLKAKYPRLRVLISLGGWSWSNGFYTAARPENREAFVASCIDAYIKGNLPVLASGVGGPGAAAGVFDGIDVDWEYPGVCGKYPGCGADAIQDPLNFRDLMAEFRRQLDAWTGITGKEYLLTAAMPAGQPKFSLLPLGQVAGPVDFMNLMAYDFHTSAEPNTSLGAALSPYGGVGDPTFYGDYAVQQYVSAITAAGQPKSKLVFGVPFYGWGWMTAVNDPQNGLYQPAVGLAPGEFPPDNGVGDYNWLKPKVTAAGWQSFVASGTVYSYKAATGEFWTYDNPATATQKGSYMCAQRLGGSMFWDLSGDTSTGELISALRSGGGC